MRGSRPHNPTNEYVIVDGIYFYKETNSGYYLGNVRIPNRKRKYPMRLHNYIWQKYNGEIPKGYHVHHIDENKDNNDISNLELLKAFDHLSLHAYEKSDLARNNMLTVVQPYAAKWHGSKAGKKFHVEHYKKYTEEKWMKPITKICSVCGKEYTTNQASATKSKYCSNNCKSAARRKSGIDNISCICPICHKTYTKNKYSKSTVCKDCLQIKAESTRQRKKAARQSSNHLESKTDDLS